MNVKFQRLMYVNGTQILKICEGHLKILGARMVTWKTPHTKDPKISDATV